MTAYLSFDMKAVPHTSRGRGPRAVDTAMTITELINLLETARGTHGGDTLVTVAEATYGHQTPVTRVSPCNLAKLKDWDRPMYAYGASGDDIESWQTVVVIS